jgi:hypothetical protein
MRTQEKPAEYRSRLPDWLIARLLGLGLKEYLNLAHRGLQEFKDLNGNVVEYYIHISSNNDPAVLGRLNIDRSNFARFRPEQINEIISKH